MTPQQLGGKAVAAKQPPAYCPRCHRPIEFGTTWHQSFKFEFIAPAPREGVNIPFTTAMGWLLDRFTDDEIFKLAGGGGSYVNE
jgi:hypothetical protein